VKGRLSTLGDLYHFLLNASWLRLLTVLTMAYLAANALFACGYLLAGDGISNARPGSFADAFFFSVQTLATIGYGSMVPGSLYANLLVTFEAAGRSSIRSSTGARCAG
jgi:inward rectifier potassium channel